MRFTLVFVVVLAISAAQFPGDAAAVASSRVASSDQNANVIRYENDANPDGSFRYNFETDNGIAADAQGTPRDFGGNPPVAPVVSQGSFSWTSPEGQLIVITYTADENGYHPSGDAIPTPPTASDIGSSITNPLQRSQNRRT